MLTYDRALEWKIDGISKGLMTDQV